MELRQYLKVLKRRWYLIVVPALIVLAVGLVTYRPAPAVYNTGVRLIVAQPPAAASAESDEERLANWHASEYIVNALADWVRGGRFAERVSQRLAEKGIDASADAVWASTATDNVRSVLLLSMTHSDPEMLVSMMEATIEVLQEENMEALPQLGSEPAMVVPLDVPVVNRVPGSLRAQLDLPLRLALALAAGAGLALLAEYFDPTIRDRDDLEALELPLLAEIPKK